MDFFCLVFDNWTWCEKHILARWMFEAGQGQGIVLLLLIIDSLCITFGLFLYGELIERKICAT